jgi:hypothetical protein
MSYKYSCNACNYHTNNQNAYNLHKESKMHLNINLNQYDPKLDIIIYILYFNDDTKKLAYSEFGFYPWAKPIYIQSTPYLESIMYTDILETLKDEWINKKYVGTLSYKANSKIKIPDIAKLINNNIFSKADVVGFHPFNTVNQTNSFLIKHAIIHHRDFLPIWIYLLNKLGFTPFQYANKSLPTIFCNYWYTKPKLMLQYIEFMKKVKLAIQEDKVLNDAINVDSKYTSGSLTTEDCMKKFNVPYYPYHPFICERLAGFYFYTLGANIIHYFENSLT